MSCFYDRRTGLLPLEIEVNNTDRLRNLLFLAVFTALTSKKMSTDEPEASSLNRKLMSFRISFLLFGFPGVNTIEDYPPTMYG